MDSVAVILRFGAKSETMRDGDVGCERCEEEVYCFEQG